MGQPSTARVPAANAAPSSTPDTRLRGRWLLLARGIWGMLALALFANWIASLIAYDQLLQTVCNNVATCQQWQPTPGNAQALHRLGLSVDTYAAYFISVEIIVSLVFWIVGALIFWRKSDEWLGLLVPFVLILFASFGLSDTLALAWAGGQPSSSVLVVVTSQIPAFLQWSSLGLFLVTFPTGRFAPRWTWVIAFLWVAQFFAFDVPAQLFGAGFWPGLYGVILLTWGSTAVVLFYRYLRVFTPLQRQQTKWVVFGIATGVLMSTLSNIIGAVVPGLSAPDSPYQLLSGLFTALLFIPIPLSIGIAILRHQLWDIDAIINKALVYGLLTGILGALYAGLIIGLENLAGLIGGQAATNPVVLVISTLAIAALFLPARRRIQSLIDRRFYRRKYDAEKTLAAFSATLRNEVDLNQLSEQLIAVVNETMQPAQVSLWLRPLERRSEEQPHRLGRVE